MYRPTEIGSRKSPVNVKQHTEELEYHVAVSESDLLNSRFLQVTATDVDLGMLSY